MVFLDALLAFFMTILMFSLVGTVLVDATIRRLKLRSDGLRTVLRRLYLDYQVLNGIDLPPAKASEEASTFADTIINYASPKKDLHREDSDVAEQARLYHKYARLEWLREETLVMALGLEPDPAVETARTAGVAAAAAPIPPAAPAVEAAVATAAAAAAVAPPHPKPAPRVNLFSDKNLTLFRPEHGKEFVKYVRNTFNMRAENQGRLFAGQARRMSFCYAFTVAVALNVHSYDIFQELMSNAAKRGAVTSTFQAQSFQEESAQILADEATPGQTRRTLGQIENVGLRLGWQGSSIAASIAKWKKDWRERQAASGMHGITGAVGTLASAMSTARQFWRTWLFWLVNIIVSGILIGQGAPFWFDQIKRVMDLKQGKEANK